MPNRRGVLAINCDGNLHQLVWDDRKGLICLFDHPDIGDGGWISTLEGSTALPDWVWSDIENKAAMSALARCRYAPGCFGIVARMIHLGLGVNSLTIVKTHWSILEPQLAGGAQLRHTLNWRKHK